MLLRARANPVYSGLAAMFFAYDGRFPVCGESGVIRRDHKSKPSSARGKSWAFSRICRSILSLTFHADAAHCRNGGPVGGAAANLIWNCGRRQ
jgi:hypothetical protein